MSRIAPVIKREFTEMVGTRSFLIGTVLAPLLIAGIFAVQFLIIAKSGGGNHAVLVLDATGRELGTRIATALESASPTVSFIAEPTFDVDVERVDEAGHGRAAEDARGRVLAGEVDGFLWLPADIAGGGTAEYEGDNATNSGAMAAVRQAVQRAVQSERLGVEGIDEGRMTAALAPVAFEAVKTAGGNPAMARILAFVMAFAIYMLVIMYGQTIMQAVQEEKRDRIVELIVSSVHARDLLIGKVVAIGAAGLLQMTIWIVGAGLLVANAAGIALTAGADEAIAQALAQQGEMPEMPVGTAILFVLYFLGGFLLFATMFAVIGAVVTSTQEAQQFVMPVMLPLMLGVFIAMPAVDNPNSVITVIGSLVPFTAPMVMPVRSMMSGVPWPEIGLSLALLFGSALLTVWLAAKVYRIAIFATGKKPSMRELVRWMRTA